MEKLGLQGSVQWLMDRCGKVTASRFKDVLATLANGKPAKAREDYLYEIVIERLTGQPTDHYISKPMQDGIEREPFARMRYEAESGAIVEEVGFMPHPELEGVGGSPDGLVGADGLIEIKCPTAATHLRTLLDGMPSDHAAQIQGLLWITGRKWGDFVSYYPDLPKPLDVYIKRVERDEEYIGKLAAAVAGFLADAETLIARLQPAANESAPEEAAESVRPAGEIVAPVEPPPAADPPDDYITPDQCADLEAMCGEYGITVAQLKKAAKVDRLAMLKAADYDRALAWVRKHKEAA